MIPPSAFISEFSAPTIQSTASKMDITEPTQDVGDTLDRIQLPGYFEDVQLDDLVVLIGELGSRLSRGRGC